MPEDCAAIVGAFEFDRIGYTTMDPKGGLKIPTTLFGKKKVEFEDLKKPEQTDHGKANYVTMTKYPEDLFPPGSPKIDDLKQGQIGDCFLIAAIQAILVHPRGAEWIHSLMVDLGLERPKEKPGRDNPPWVVVRLWDITRGEHYIKVKKAAVVSSSTLGGKTADIKTPLHEGPLWLSILVTAYSAFDDKGNYDPNTPSFARLNKGGMPDIALRILTGTFGDRVEILNLKEKTDKENFMLGNGGDREKDHRDNVRLLFDVLPNPSQSNDPLNRGEIQRKVFNKDQTLMTDYLNWLGANSLKIKTNWGGKVTYLKHHEAFANLLVLQKNKQLTTLRIEDLDRFFAQNSPIPATTAVATWARSNKVVSGKRFANHYTPNDEGLFSQIEDCIRAGKPTALSTREYVGNPTGSGHSANEPISKGLVGTHAYAVTNTRRSDDELWVEVRNPWGSYGREYKVDVESGRKKPTASSDVAQFWLTLSDVTKRFRGIFTNMRSFR